MFFKGEAMPPKAKFTKEEIVAAALRVVESEGIEALTARTLASELGSSPRPIFTVFDGMDDVVEEVNKRANVIYGDYVKNGLEERLAFRGVGLAYIRFARERPRLFRLLFMQERKERPNVESVLRGIEEHYEQIMASIVDEYHINTEKAEELYLNLWIFLHGIAVMTVTEVCKFDEEQISHMLTQVFKALLIKIKTENVNA